MEAAAPGAAQFLPQEVVTVLLAHVGRRERLRVCALVCRAWRAAAAAASSRISVLKGTEDSIEAWLCSNGPQLAALQLFGPRYSWRESPRLQLAWGALAGLRQLSVQACDLGSSDSSRPSSLRRLTSLRLVQCTLAWPGGLAALAALTALRQLELSGVIVPDSTSELAAASLGSALRQLRQLTRLELHGAGMAADAETSPGGWSKWLAQRAALEMVGTDQRHSIQDPYRGKLGLQLTWPALAGLRQLSVQACELGSSSDSSSPSSLRRLTSLRLEGCALAWPRGLAALAALTGLLQLELRWATVPGSTSEQLAASLGSVLCQLRQLTLLELWGEGLAADAALAPSLSRLTQLRELECGGGTNLTAASFAASLPASLTQLVCSSRPLQLSASSSPGLAQLSGLQHLELPCHSGFEPALLGGWPALRHLRLHCGPWLPAGTQPAAGAVALLAALAQLPALEHLQLSGSLAGAPAAACSALVASSALTCLHVGECQLPAACGASLFGRPLTRLRWLLLGDDSECGVTLTASSVARLAASCSELLGLRLCCSAEAGQALAPLTALARLTSLRASGRCVGRWAAQHVLAALTGLRRLELRAPHMLSWAGLMRLTALQQLQRLWVDRTDRFKPRSLGTDVSGNLELVARPGNEPVWQQLHHACSSGGGAAGGLNAVANGQLASVAAAAEHAADLADAEAQAARLQQAASDAWGQALQLVQQLAQRDSAAQHLLQQLAGQRARADQLQQQVTQARGETGQLLQFGTELLAAVAQLSESEEVCCYEEGHFAESAPRNVLLARLAQLHTQAAALQQPAGRLQERGAGTAAQLGMVQQQLALAQQLAQRLAEEQAQRLAVQQPQAAAQQQQQRIRELEAQLAEQRELNAELRAQLAVRRA